MRPLTLFLLVLLAGLQFALWAGDKNVFDLHRLQNAVASTEAANSTQERGNQRLLAEVLDLKGGGETVETLARYNLGLIKPNEVFYQIVE